MKGHSKKEIEEAKGYIRAWKAIEEPEFAKSLMKKNDDLDSVLKDQRNVMQDYLFKNLDDYYHDRN